MDTAALSEQKPIQSTLLAYQPIFDRDLNVVGGELLYRSDDGISALEIGEMSATSNVIYNLFTGISEQFDGFNHPLFINVSADFLASDTFLPIEPSRVIVELVERITPDDAVVENVKRWAKQGFRFAFDDFEYSYAWEPLLKYCDIIKVDISQVTVAQARELKAKINRPGMIWLAERVETQVDFQMYKALGFDYFQGYFFARPINLNGVKIPPSATNLARIINELYDPEVDVTRLTTSLKNEPGLSVKLLKVANSAFYRTSKPLENLQQALMRLGIEQVRKWVMLISALEMSNCAAAQLVLTRASTCAEVARRFMETSIDPDKAFLAGLLSGSDILLNVDKQTFVSSLDLSNEIKDAAIRQRGAMGALIRMVEQVETAQYQWQSNTQDNLTQPVTPKLGPTGLKIIGIYREQAIENQKFVSSMS